jgi:hypothetical protein
MPGINNDFRFTCDNATRRWVLIQTTRPDERGAVCRKLAAHEDALTREAALLDEQAKEAARNAAVAGDQYAKRCGWTPAPGPQPSAAQCVDWKSSAERLSKRANALREKAVATIREANDAYLTLEGMGFAIDNGEWRCGK